MIRVPDKYKIKDGNIRDVLKQLEELRVDKEERLENASDERAEQLQAEVDELSRLIDQATEEIKKIEAEKAARAAQKEMEAQKEAAKKSANMVAAGAVTDDVADEAKKHNIPMVDDGRKTPGDIKTFQGGNKLGSGNDTKPSKVTGDSDKKQATAKAEKERAKADAEHEKELVAKAKAIQKEGKKAQDAEDKKAAEDAKKAAEQATKAGQTGQNGQSAPGATYTDAMQQGATAMMNKDYKTANERFSLVANAPTRGKDIPTVEQRSEAMYFLAKIFEQGLGVSVDKKRAFYWYEQSAKLGYVEACKECGMEYTLRKPQNLTEDAEDVKMALYYFGLAAEKGNADAKTKYIQVCEQRSITKAQLNKALKYCDDFMAAEKDSYIRDQWKDRRDKLKAKFKENPQVKTAGGGFSVGTAIAMAGSVMTILGCLYMAKAYAYNTNFELLKFNKLPVISLFANRWSAVAKLYGYRYGINVNEGVFGSALTMFLLGRFFERFSQDQSKLMEVTSAIGHVLMGLTVLLCSVIARYYYGYGDEDLVLLMVFMVIGVGLARMFTGMLGSKVAGLLKVS